LVGSNPSSRPRAQQKWGYNLLTSLSSGTSVKKTASFNMHFLLAVVVGVLATSADAAGGDPKGGFCCGCDFAILLPSSSSSLSIAYCH
jgi:hypothetical protein